MGDVAVQNKYYTFKNTEEKNEFPKGCYSTIYGTNVIYFNNHEIGKKDTNSQPICGDEAYRGKDGKWYDAEGVEYIDPEDTYYNVEDKKWHDTDGKIYYDPEEEKTLLQKIKDGFYKTLRDEGLFKAIKELEDKKEKPLTPDQIWFIMEEALINNSTNDIELKTRLDELKKNRESKEWNLAKVREERVEIIAYYLAQKEKEKFIDGLGLKKNTLEEYFAHKLADGIIDKISEGLKTAWNWIKSLFTGKSEEKVEEDTCSDNDKGLKELFDTTCSEAVKNYGDAGICKDEIMKKNCCKACQSEKEEAKKEETKKEEAKKERKTTKKTGVVRRSNRKQKITKT